MLFSVSHAPQLQDVWSFDPTSFVIGMIVTLLIVGMLFISRQQLSDGWRIVQARIRRLREQLSAGAETRYYEALQDRLAELHIAEHIAPFDRLYVPPHFEAPIPRPSLVRQQIDSDVLTLRQTLAAAPKLAVLGTSGSGRTMLLVYLAHIFADKQVSGELQLEEDRMPLLLHLADIDWQAPYKDPVTPLVTGAIAHAPRLLAANFASFLKEKNANEDLLILIDGWDEIPAGERPNAAQWLESLLKQFPQHRYVITASTRNCGALYQAGFTCMPLAGLDVNAVKELSRHWLSLVGGVESDTTLLFEMMQQPPGRAPLPLDLTLTASVWHRRGVMPLNIVSAYAQWLDDALQDGGVLDTDMARSILGHAAWTIFKQDRTPFNERLTLTQDELGEIVTQIKAKPEYSPEEEDKNAQSAEDITNRLAGNRAIFIPLAGELTFVHDRITSYLAATHARDTGAVMTIAANVDDPDWEDVAYFFAGLDNPAPIVEAALAQPDDIFHTTLTRLGHWASLAGSDAKWPNQVLNLLGQVLMAAETPGNLREHIMRTIVASRFIGVTHLFKQMLERPEGYLKTPGLHAFGLMRRESDVPIVAALLEEADDDIRIEALRVLGHIGTPAAVDALAGALLELDDELRRAAAEALADCGKPGWELLEEGAKLGDDQGSDMYRVRRATVYGLARINQPWANELLTTLARDDPQWIVKSGAQDALALARGEKAEDGEDLVPLDLTRMDIDDVGWLIEWGAARGESIGPGPASRKALRRALDDEAIKVRLAAINTYAHLGEAEAIPALQSRLNDKESSARDAAYRALVEIARRTNKVIPLN